MSWSSLITWLVCTVTAAFAERGPVPPMTPAARFATFKVKNLADSQFSVSGPDLGVLIFPDGRVVGHHRRRWIEFTASPVNSGAGPDAELTWASRGDGLALLLCHRPDKIYDPHWELNGGLTDARTGRTWDQLVAWRNPRLVSETDARRALTRDYVRLTEAGEIEIADQMLGYYDDAWFAQFDGPVTRVAPGDCVIKLN